MDSKKFNGNWNNLGEGYNLSYVFFVWTFQIFFLSFYLSLRRLLLFQNIIKLDSLKIYWSVFLEYQVERCAISELVRFCWHIKIYQWNRFGFFFSSKSWYDNLPMLKGFSEYHPIDHVKIVKHAKHASKHASIL